MTRKEEAYVIGAGMTVFGRHEDRSLESLGVEAVRSALADAGMDYSEIEIAFCGHVLQGTTAGQRVLQGVGLSGIPIINVENACASGSTAFFQAVMAVETGMVDVALALGFERMARGPIPTDPRDSRTAERPKSAPPMMPAMFAEVFKAHSRKYGTRVEQMAMVSVKNHENAALNPKAQYGHRVNREEVITARMVAEPLTLLMCCPTSSGAAAAIVANRSRTQGRAKAPVAVIAAALESERGAGAGDPLYGITEINTRAANKAYEQAGIRPDALNVVELHDCFAIAEIVHYENLGLCERGEGGKFIEAGLSARTGKVAVSTSGGLLAKGHPLGATGVAQVVEVVEQLRGESGPRQVPNAKYGLIHCQGFGGAVGVHILTI
jgi:acetyl-CoA acyltransferase